MKRIKLFFAIISILFLINSLAFAQDTTLTVTSTGKVGIGTTNPAEVLSVGGDISLLRTGVRRLHVEEEPDNNTVGKSLTIQAGSASSSGIPFLAKPGGNLILQAGNGYNANIPGADGGDVIIRSGANHFTGTDNGGDVIFEAGAGDNTFIERMRILENGNVGIGTAGPSFPLEMASGAHVTAGGVWTNASSKSLKENIRDLTGDEAVQTLSGLVPKRYNYKVDKNEEYLGFIAEDVPQLVASGDRKSLSPMDIVAVLTRVAQEQQKQIAELEARLNAIE